MAVTKVFSWIHLSDIHVGHGNATHGYDQRLVVHSLERDLTKAKLRQELADGGVSSFDAIFVTGDIAFSGNRRLRKGQTTGREYQDAAKWLRECAQDAGVALQSVYLVPGNHDIERELPAENKRAQLVWVLRDTRAGLDDALDDEDKYALLRQRLTNYMEFSQDFAPACRGELWWQECFIRSGIPIRLVGLNTTLLAADDEDFGRLQLGERQLVQTMDEPRPRKNELMITLSHHPLEDGWLADSEGASAWVGSFAPISLSGHLHRTETLRLIDGSATDRIRIRAGAVHDEQQEASGPAQHAYSIGAIVAVDSGGRRRLKVRIWPRHWSERRKGFVCEVDSVKEGKSYAEFDLPSFDDSSGPGGRRRQTKPPPATHQHLPWGLAQELARLDSPEAGEDLPLHAAVLEQGSRYLFYLHLAYCFHVLCTRENDRSIVSSRLIENIHTRLATPWSDSSETLSTPFDTFDLTSDLLRSLRDWNPNDPIVEDLLACCRASCDDQLTSTMAAYEKQRRRAAWFAAWSQFEHLSLTAKRQTCQEWRDLLKRRLLAPPLRRFSVEIRRGERGMLSLTGARPRRDLAGAEAGSEVFVHRREAQERDGGTRFGATPFLRLADREPRLLFLGWPTDPLAEGSTLRYTDFEPYASRAGQRPDFVWTECEGTLDPPWLRAAGLRRLSVGSAQQRLVYQFENHGTEPLVIEAFKDVLPSGICTVKGSDAIEIGRIELAPGTQTQRRPVLATAIPPSTHLRPLEVRARQGRVEGFIAMPEERRSRVADGLICTRRFFRRAGPQWQSFEPSTSSAEHESAIAVGEDIKVVLEFVNEGAKTIGSFVYQDDLQGTCDAMVTALEASAETGSKSVLESDGPRIRVRSTDAFEADAVVSVSYCLCPRHEGSLTVRAATVDNGKAVHKGTRVAQCSTVPPDAELRVVPGANSELEVRAELESQALGFVDSTPVVRIRIRNRGACAVESVKLLITRAAAQGTETVNVTSRLAGFCEAVHQLPLRPDSGGAYATSVELSARHVGGGETIQSVADRDDPLWLWKRVARLDGFQGRAEAGEALWLALYKGEKPAFIEGESGLGKQRLVQTFHLSHSETAKDSVEMVVLKCPRVQRGEPEDAWLRSVVRQLWEHVEVSFPDNVRERSRQERVQAFVAPDTVSGELHNLLLDPAVSNRGQDHLFVSAEAFFSAYLRYTRRRSQTDRVRLLLVFSDASRLDEASADLLIDFYGHMRRCRYSDIFWAFTDSHCPERLRASTHVVRLRPWSLEEWKAVCRSCFLYPRLSEDAIRQIYDRANGVPAVADAITKKLRETPSMLVVDSIGVRIAPHVRAQDLDGIADAMLGEEMAKIVARVEPSPDDRSARLFVGLVGCIGERTRKRALVEIAAAKEAIGMDVAVATLLLEELARAGWVLAYGPDHVQAPRRKALCNYMQKIVNEAERRPFEDGLLLAELHDQAYEQAARRLLRTSPRVCAGAVETLLAAAEAHTEAGQDDQAQTLYAALGACLDQSSPSVPLVSERNRARIVLEAARLAWNRGNRDEALGWRDRLLSSRGHRWRKLRMPKQELALFAAWANMSQVATLSTAFKVLRHQVITGTSWRRLCCLRRTGLLRMVSATRDHQLLALEILFFSRDVSRFLRLYRKLMSVYDDLAPADQQALLDTLWRISEDERTPEVLRAPWLKPRERTALNAAVDRETLFGRTEALYAGLEEQVPIRIGLVFYRQWQARWPHRVEHGLDHSELLTNLHRAIQIFEGFAAQHLLARSLRDLGTACIELLDERPDERAMYASEAYISLHRAADINESIGLDRPFAETLRLAVRARIGKGRDAELKVAGAEIVRDLERLFLAKVQTEDEREATRELMLRAALITGDDATFERHIGQGEKRHLRHLEYQLARKRATQALAKVKDEGGQDAYRHLSRCLTIIDDVAEQRLSGTPMINLGQSSFEEEEAFIVARLAEVCLALDKHNGARTLLIRLLEIAARWRRGSEKPAHAYWSAIDADARADAAETAKADRCVVKLFRACLQTWPEERPRFAPKTDLFRQHVLSAFAGACLKECFALLAKDATSGSRTLNAIERIDAAVLAIEVGVRLREPVAADLEHLDDQLSLFELDGNEPEYTVTVLRRALRIILETRRGVDAVIAYLKKAIGHTAYAVGASEAVAKGLTASLEPLLAAVRAGDSDGRTYYESFIKVGIGILEGVPSEQLSSAALEDLVRTELFYQADHERALRWMHLWVQRALTNHDSSSFSSLMALLCSLLASSNQRLPWSLVQGEDSKPMLHMLAPESLQEREAARRSAIAIVRQALQECLLHTTWLTLDTRLSLLFHVVEKVLGDRHRDLRFVTGLMLFRIHQHVDSSSLKLLSDGWLDTPPSRDDGGQSRTTMADRWRVGMVLILAELASLWPISNKVLIMSDKTSSWNLLVTVQRLFHTVQAGRRFTSELRPKEAEFLEGLTTSVEHGSHLWALHYAEQELPHWRNVEALDHMEIELVPLLAQHLEGHVGPLRAYGDAYSRIVQRVDAFRVSSREDGEPTRPNIARRLTWLPSLDETSEILRHFHAVARTSVETMADHVARLGLSELFMNVMDRLVASPSNDDPEFVEPEHVDPSELLNGYHAAMLRDFHTAVYAQQYASLMESFVAAQPTA